MILFTWPVLDLKGTKQPISTGVALVHSEGMIILVFLFVCLFWWIFVCFKALIVQNWNGHLGPNKLCK